MKNLRREVEPLPFIDLMCWSKFAQEWLYCTSSEFCQGRALAMFTAYVDDSGTAPEHKVAVAAALIVPVYRSAAFQSEWNTFKEKWKISDFHSSSCAVANKTSDTTGWNTNEINKAFERVRQITKKFGVKAFSLAVHKDDYESVISENDPARPTFGHFHYTYAVHNLLSFLDSYACQTGEERAMEYVFDSIGEKTDRIQRAEIEDALTRMEQVRPGRFGANYSFGKRKDHPGLQCVDLVAWTCYRASVNTWRSTPSTPLQEECYRDFSNYRNGNWLTVIGQTKQQLQAALESLRQSDQSRPIQVRATVV